MATKFDDVPEWPGEAKPAATHIGHNKPPIEEIIPEEFRAELLREKPYFFDKLSDLEGSAERATCTSEDELGRCGDLVKTLRAAEKHVEETHKAVKQPYLDGGRLVDGEKKALLERIAKARKKIDTPMNAFIAEREARERAERERQAAEERRQAEAAAQAERERQAASGENDPDAIAEIEAVAHAPVQHVRNEPVRSDGGSTVSAKTVWNSEVTDYDVAYIAVSDNDKVREAIDKAVAQLVRAGKREIEGVRIWPTKQAITR